jgi:c-di-GMP-binding flagellar brake protein YcgR
MEGTMLVSATERRNTVRFQPDKHCPFLTVVHDGHHRPATLRDLSATGAGFVLEQALELGEPVRVEIFSAASHCWYLKAARVVHSEHQPLGDWLTGVEFVKQFEPPDIQELFPEYQLIIVR